MARLGGRAAIRDDHRRPLERKTHVVTVSRVEGSKLEQPEESPHADLVEAFVDVGPAEHFVLVSRQHPGIVAIAPIPHHAAAGLPARMLRALRDWIDRVFHDASPNAVFPPAPDRTGTA